MNNITIKNGNIVLNRFNPKGKEMDDILNICSTFGYILEMRHDKRFPLAPVITNGDGSRFGYLQKRKALHIKTKFSLALKIDNQEYTVYFTESDYLEYDEINDKAIFEAYPGKNISYPVRFFMNEKEDDLCELVDCIYFVFKTNMQNLSALFHGYQEQLNILKRENNCTREMIQITANSFRISALS